MDKKRHKQQTILGLKWSVVNQLVTQSITFVLGIVLMRLVSPKEFGLLGMVLVFSGFLSVFRDFGLGSSLIQKKDITNDDINTVYWTTLGLGAFLTLTLILCSSFIANYYHEPRLRNIAFALSFVFVIQSLAGVQQSIVKKEMKFELVAKVNIFAAVISGVVALILAFNDFGVWALVVKQLIMQGIITFFYLFLSQYKLSFFWSKAVLKKHLKFSLPLVGRGSLNYWSRNADNFFIGKFLGAEALGYYSRSYSIMMLPVSQISGVISSVMFPSLSIIKDDEIRVREIFLKLTRVIAYITFPLMLILFLVSKSFVVTVLGEEWIGMIHVMQILCLVGALQSVATLNGNIFLVKDKTNWAFYLNIFNSIFYVSGFYIGTQYSIEVTASIYFVLNIFLLIIGWNVIARLLNSTLSKLVKNLSNHLMFFIVIIVVGTITLEYLELNDLVILMLVPIFVIGSWWTLFQFFGKNINLEIKGIVIDFRDNNK